MIQPAKLVSRLILVLTVGIATSQFAACQSGIDQPPEQEFLAHIEMPLPYFDPLTADFLKLDSDQLARFAEIKRNWQKEYRDLMRNEASRREIIAVFNRNQEACGKTLSKKQKTAWKRFAVFNSLAPDEFNVITRAIRLGGIEIDEKRRNKIQALRKQWIEWVDRNHRLPFRDNVSGWDELEKERAPIRELRDQKAEEYRSSIQVILNEKQQKRLSELQWQKFVTVNTLDSFRAESTVELLKFTRKQRLKIDALIEAVEKEPNRFKATRMQLEGYKTIFHSLTEDQKSTWNETLGEPFLVTNLRWLFNFMNETQ